MLPTLVGAAVPESKAMLIAVVTFSGILIVFGILLLLIMIFYAYGWIFQAVSARSERQKAKKAEKAAAKAAAESEQTAQPAAAAVAAAADAQPTASDEVPPEIVAAIAAAVYATYGGGYAVRRVRRAPEGRRSAWASTGVYENTRPF